MAARCSAAFCCISSRCSAAFCCIGTNSICCSGNSNSLPQQDAQHFAASAPAAFGNSNGLPQQDAQLEPETLYCLTGHVMNFYQRLPGDNHWCDLCKQKVEEGSWLFSCDPCDFDVCLVCRLRQLAQREQQIRAGRGAQPGAPKKQTWGPKQ